uniref:alpha-1,6-mannosyl-glycoprotein 6-beta-N-acetylglucosaminyltransferase n=1 Tax=Caenorhabditis tropicalis TaxID=1561998 RepID=A0A1I7TD32_9PELO
MRRSRRFFALLFIFSAFFTPLGFFYFTIVNESNQFGFSKSTEERNGYQTSEVSEPTENVQVDFKKYSEYECSRFPSNVTNDYPECLNKMKWIKNGWKTHSCYSENHIDGTNCSFRYYLSQVENYCPMMGENTKQMKSLAKMSPSIRRLLPIFDGIPHYMKTRINRLWKKWKEGAHEVMEKYSESMTNRKKLNVLVFIGFLANEQKLKLAKKSDHGGPLGELLQWSDLLATLSIIGHHLEVSTDKSSLKSIVWKYMSRGPCQFLNGSRQQLDIIFTDIMGLNILRQHHRQFLMNNRCRIRLLDSFGTHAEFATKSYFLQNKRKLSGPYSQRNPWGGHGLDLRQHWTFYPHSDDNTFLGFIVDTEGVEKENQKKKTSIPSALIYGKEKYMWMNAEKPIRMLKKHVKVHATVADLEVDGMSNITSLFENVQNHGFLNSREISELLDETTIFFGLGFPLEGPAPLEAMAHGAVFINAKFEEPKSRKNYKFLSEKPTLREWTSQNPYMEKIGEPHVITVDVNNETELEDAIKRAIQLKPKPFVPFEFSPSGMLLRVALLLEKQELCEKVSISKRWPPVTEMKIFKTEKANDSCEMTCHSLNLICEPSFFPIVNSSPLLKRELSCSSVSSDSSPFAPFNCTVQLSASLFSCASRPPSSSGIVRLCPCRDYIPEQHAICKKCL